MSVEIGRTNSLRIVKEVDFGLYLDGGEHGEILLPKRYVPENYKIDEVIDVFVYLDSEDRIITTTEKPFTEVDEFAYLEVVAVNSVGAFLDWGLMKDLFVPFREQKVSVSRGEWHVVFVYFDDESQRIATSTRLDKFTGDVIPEYLEGEEVDLLIVRKTDLGYQAVVDDLHLGLIYENEVFRELQIGERTKGFIKKMREDDKIDISLQKLGFWNIGGVAENIMNILQENGGTMPVSDKSSPEIISKHFQISKKSFKKAIGTLYKKKLISISKTEIKIV